MGPGVPYAIGAKFAHPDRPAIALVGDGAMQMNGMAELITVKRYWQEWSDPRLIVAVLHNNDLNQVTWEMRAMEGAPKFEESQSLPDVSYAGVRRQPRSAGHRGPPSPTRSAGAWRQGLAADRPDRPRRPHRPRRPADPAARHLRTDEGRRRRRCSRGDEDALGGHQDRDQAEGAGVPARAKGRMMAAGSEVCHRSPGRDRPPGRCTTSAPGASSGPWPVWPRPVR